MDYKRIRTDNSIATRDLNNFDKKTDNIYESLVIISRRANQIASDLREELNEKIQEFGGGVQQQESTEDTPPENNEQIELARYYEQMPKPSLLAIYEFLHNQIYYRLPEEEAKR